MSIHGICYDEGQSGHCGPECEGFISGDCSIPEEILDTIATEAGYTLYITTEKPNRRTTMRQNHILSLLQEDYATVKVSFKVDSAHGDGKLYTFKTKLFHQVGDLVVVPNYSEGFKVVRVVEYHDEPLLDLDSDYDYRWIVGILDLTDYQTTLNEEAYALQNLQKIEAISQRKRALDALATTTGTSIDDMRTWVLEGKPLEITAPPSE